MQPYSDFLIQLTSTVYLQPPKERIFYCVTRTVVEQCSYSAIIVLHSGGCVVYIAGKKAGVW